MKSETNLNIKYLQCWGGNNEFGQLGIVNTNSVRDYSVGDEFTCILYSDFNYSGLSCIGDNSLGQTDIPISISKSKKDILESGDGHTCVSILNSLNIFQLTNNSPAVL